MGIMSHIDIAVIKLSVMLHYIIMLHYIMLHYIALHTLHTTTVRSAYINNFVFASRSISVQNAKASGIMSVRKDCTYEYRVILDCP